jgi:hypothetical protein
MVAASVPVLMDLVRRLSPAERRRELTYSPVRVGWMSRAQTGINHRRRVSRERARSLSVNGADVYREMRKTESSHGKQSPCDLARRRWDNSDFQVSAGRGDRSGPGTTAPHGGGLSGVAVNSKGSALMLALMVLAVLTARRSPLGSPGRGLGLPASSSPRTSTSRRPGWKRRSKVFSASAGWARYRTRLCRTALAEFMRVGIPPGDGPGGDRFQVGRHRPLGILVTLERDPGGEIEVTAWQDPRAWEWPS